MQKYCAYYKSGLGWIKITGNEDGISGLDFLDSEAGIEENSEVHSSLKECLKQLDEYFRGERREFTVKLQPEGTGFQKRVWNELLKIPYGQTVSYRDIARGIGNEKAVRAVGGANGKNKIGIIIPCHRVIGSNKTLTGYAGGLWRKEWLLKHENT